MRITLTVAATLFLFSCKSKNEQEVFEWIKVAPKPITVTKTGWTTTGHSDYYLKDSKGRTRLFKHLILALPDTIR